MGPGAATADHGAGQVHGHRCTDTGGTHWPCAVADTVRICRHSNVSHMSQIDSGLRGLAIEWLVSFVEKRPGMLGLARFPAVRASQGEVPEQICP